MSDHLKSIIQDLINGRNEQALVTFHQYSVEKTQEAAGLTEKKWSADVETKWTPPEGLFKKSAEAIASHLKRASDSHKQAAARLSFYINRAGKNLSAEEKSRLKDAEGKLRAMYKEGLNEGEDKKFVVATVHCEYDKNGDTKSGTFKLYAPTSDVGATKGGFEAADLMDEYEDLMHKVAQNVWGSSAMISVDTITPKDLKVVDEQPDGRDVFRAPKGI